MNNKNIEKKLNARFESTRTQRNRRKQLNLMMKFSQVTFLIILVGLFVISIINISSDKVEAQGNYEKVIVAVEVKSGDTLWDFANQYANKDYYKNNREYIREVCNLNGLNSNEIYSGKTIAIPMIKLK